MSAPRFLSQVFSTPGDVASLMVGSRLISQLCLGYPTVNCSLSRGLNSFESNICYQAAKCLSRDRQISCISAPLIFPTCSLRSCWDVTRYWNRRECCSWVLGWRGRGRVGCDPLVSFSHYSPQFVAPLSLPQLTGQRSLQRSGQTNYNGLHSLTTPSPQFTPGC